MNPLSERAARNLAAVREKSPLIHNITNFVVMNFTANALISMGASPVMAHAENEVAEMASLAGSLVLNIGTLTDSWVASMIRAGKKAAEKGIPVVLDPVGAGATALRTDSARRIIREVRLSVIRGNPSEILALRQGDAGTKGVDSVHSVRDAAHAATLLAGDLNTAIAVTGPVDFITDGRRTFHVHNGHPLMGWITGTGCAATAIIGAFLAVDPDPALAAATALAFFGWAGESAGIHASAPGSYLTALIDALFTVTPEQLMAGCKITEGRCE